MNVQKINVNILTMTVKKKVSLPLNLPHKTKKKNLK